MSDTNICSFSRKSSHFYLVILGARHIWTKSAHSDNKKNERAHSSVQIHSPWQGDILSYLRHRASTTTLCRSQLCSTVRDYEFGYSIIPTLFFTHALGQGKPNEVKGACGQCTIRNYINDPLSYPGLNWMTYRFFWIVPTVKNVATLNVLIF